MEFSNAFGMAYSIKYDPQLIAGKLIHLKMITDSLSVFYLLTKMTITTERRLLTDRQTVKRSYDCLELRNVARTNYEQNISVVLTEVSGHNVVHVVLVPRQFYHPIISNNSRFSGVIRLRVILPNKMGTVSMSGYICYIRA